ncbi:MAG: hypothetical protein V1886_03740 [archaeon]
MPRVKETLFILLAAAVLGYVTSFPMLFYSTWLKFSAIALGILLVNILAKKALAYKLGCVLEIKPWTFERYGFGRAQYFGVPIPAWLLWPVLVVWASLGNVWWLVVSTFEVHATMRRVGRKFAEVTEWDISLIAALGIIANIIAAVIAYSLGYQQISFMSMWFVFFNMLPFPAYDGGRIFFGSRIFWVFMSSLSLAVLILLHIEASATITIITAVVSAIIAAVIFYSVKER